MKKFLKALTAVLVVLALLCPASIAAPGDAVIYRRNYNGSSNIYIDSTVYYGGVVVMSDYGENIYTWTRGSGEMTAYPIPKDIVAYDEDEEACYFRKLISGDDGVYMLYELYEKEVDNNYFENMLLLKLELDGSAPVFTGIEPLELEWDELTEEWDDYSYPNDIRWPYVENGMLIGFSYDESYNDVLAVIDIEDDDMELYPMSNVASCCPYIDGKLIMIERSYENESDPVKAFAFDYTTGESEQLFEMTTTGWQYPAKPAYDPENDTLYYLYNGELYAMPGLDPAAAVAVSALKVEQWSDSPSAITEEGYYLCSDYESVVMCNTDPSQRSETSISVYTGYNSAMDMAYYDFTAENPGIEVVLLNNYEDVTQAMLNRSSAVDIYTLMVSGQEYEALLNRGYLTELDQSDIITDFVMSTYPEFQKVLVREGHVVAVPVEIYNSAWSYNPVAFKALGLTDADVPTTWAEFFALAKRLPELRGEDDSYTLFDPYYTALDARYTFYNGIIDSYMLTMQRAGTDFTFDDPELRALLETVETLDYAALGFAEEYIDDEEYRWVPEKMLFQSYGSIGCQIYNMRDEYSRLMPLGINGPDEAVISCQLNVAFVNPYSENKDAAIAYLEKAVANISDTTRIELCPGYNEPVENSYYQENLDSMDQAIESIRAELEKAEDEDTRALWQEQLDNEIEYRDEYEANYRWDVSEESIAFYRVYADAMVAARHNGFDNETGSEFYRLLEQLVQGAIDVDTFIENVDGKIRMMILENQ